MSTFAELFDDRNLIRRTAYSTPGVQTITAPAGAAWIRVSGVGAGGWNESSPGSGGGGAAFARTKTACAPGATFTLQVGDIANTRTNAGAGDSAGDSKLTRVSDSVVLLRADRGRANTSVSKGLASNSIGDVTRDGTSQNDGVGGGASGSDAADSYSLGVGGRGAVFGSVRGLRQPYAAGPGGGGMLGHVVYDNGVGYVLTTQMLPGNGLVVVEFFIDDPGY